MTQRLQQSAAGLDAAAPVAPDRAASRLPSLIYANRRRKKQKQQVDRRANRISRRRDASSNQRHDDNTPAWPPKATISRRLASSTGELEPRYDSPAALSIFTASFCIRLARLSSGSRTWLYLAGLGSSGRDRRDRRHRSLGRPPRPRPRRLCACAG